MGGVRASGYCHIVKDVRARAGWDWAHHWPSRVGAPHVALTLGAKSAALERGREIARTQPPSVTVVDGTAGDAFCAALVSPLEGRESGARRRREPALPARWPPRRPGAQAWLPTDPEVDALLV